MNTRRINFFADILFVLLAMGFGYYYRQDISKLFRGTLNQLQPCQSPIIYSIANIDPRFGLTEVELLNNIRQAEKIWELPVNKQLFEYSPTGDLKISLVYDYRQKATDEMKKIGIVVKDDRASYDLLKARYESLISSYKNEKAQIEISLTAYNADKMAYEKDVAYWNGQGGASKKEFEALEQRRVGLNDQVAGINQAKKSLNGLVDDINSTEVVLNKLAVTLNLRVSAYNEIGSSTGKVFNEGEFTSDASGEAIDIYQFDSKDQLVRVLAHELGHALGMEHLDDPKAIMYYLNEGGNEKLTSSDLADLKKVCRIK